MPNFLSLTRLRFFPMPAPHSPAQRSVRFLEGYDVTGLMPDVASTGVAGARIRARNLPSRSSEEELCADLVLDATRARLSCARVARSLGPPPPQVDYNNAHLGDASRIYQRLPGFRATCRRHRQTSRAAVCSFS